jgi:Tfp pilus assembly PilM family ATPase
MITDWFVHKPKKPEQVFAIDLGLKTIKATYFERKGNSYHLTNFAIVESDGCVASLNLDGLTEKLRNISKSIDSKTKQVIFGLGVSSVLLRQADLPMVPVSELRQLLKISPKTYFQQDMPDYEYDCFILSGKTPAEKESERPQTKCRVIIGAAKKQILEFVQSAAKSAGLVASEITSTTVGPFNAIEMTMPEVFQKECIACVDLGYKFSSITISNSGDWVLNRVVAIGAEKVINTLAESLNVSITEAESNLLNAPQDVETALIHPISYLGRELRASIDFFEHNYDKPVNQVLFGGGMARSQFILQAIQTELQSPCSAINPSSYFAVGLEASKIAELEQCAPQLVPSIGIAAGVM